MNIILLFPHLFTIVIGVKDDYCDWLYSSWVWYQIIVLPSVITFPVTNVTSSSVQFSGEVTNTGNGAILLRGVCLGVTENPDTTGFTIFAGAGTGAFGGSLVDLYPGSNYYIRAFATNEAGVSYGENQTFATEVAFPEIITNFPEEITSTSVLIGGNLLSDGGGYISSKGICYAKHNMPDTTDLYVDKGAGSESFLFLIGSLSPNSIYYFRAFAINEAGVAYGDKKQAITLVGSPKVITAPVLDITINTAQSGGEIINTGGGYIYDKGLCWSLTENPDLQNNYFSLGQGSDAFTFVIDSLELNTRYHVRAYALNQVDTAFGQNLSFTTLIALPEVETGVVESITSSTAKLYGKVTYDGAGNILSRGFCWDTSQNVDTTHTHQTAGNGMGEFSLIVAELEHNTEYYYKAYAINEAGLTYGEEKVFATLIGKPILDGIGSDELADNSVLINSRIESTNGWPIISAGICWSTDNNPDLNDSSMASDDLYNRFRVRAINLVSETTYFIRAYAVNEGGVSYSPELSITTKEEGYHIFIPSLTSVVRSDFKGWDGIFPSFGSSGNSNGYSGVAYNWDDETIFIIGSNARVIWEVVAPGSDSWSDDDPSDNYIRTIDLDNYNDPEAISYLGNGWVMIGEEGLREVSFVKITSQSNSIDKDSNAVIIDPVSLFDASDALEDYYMMEGIAYDFQNKLIYALCQVGKGKYPRLYRWDWDFEQQMIVAGSGVEVTDLFDGMTSDFTSGNDLFYHPLLNRLFIVSGKDDLVAEYHCPHPSSAEYGKLIGRRQIPRSDGESGDDLGICEGICLSPDGRFLYLCFEDQSFGYSPVSFIWFKQDNNLPLILYPFE